jgi:serine/threonine-protein kinase
VLAGKYLVERVLGQGGMGVVVAARHLELEEQVAIKFLLPDVLANPEAVARFAREARASVKIKGEHVVRTLDVGRLENGVPYMVMEYLEGMDLADRLQRHGPLGVEDAVSVALEACEALADAHALGIVHRDLKPANLFVVRRTDGTECTKVLDFGISKMTNPAMSGSGMAMTRTSALMGSPVYMSPEQMASARNVDARSDIWALGVTLYELLAGAPPFVAETLPELCTKVLTTPAPSVRDRRPDVPEGLDSTIRRCLEKDLARRYANVAELARALAPFGAPRVRHSAERVSRVLTAAGQPITLDQMPVPADVGPAAAAAQTAQATLASWGKTGAPAGRRTGLVVGLTICAFGLGIGAVLTIRSHSGAQPSAASVALPAMLAPAPSLHPATAAAEPELVSVSPVVSAAPQSPSQPSASASAAVRPKAEPRAAAPSRGSPPAGSRMTKPSSPPTNVLREYGGRKY